MRKNPAFFFSIVFIFLFSFIFPKHSFADRLYQCSPATAWPVAPANCGSGPQVDCMNPDGTTALLPNGNKCAENTGIYYSGQENKTITAICVDKCSVTYLLKICPRDSFNTCHVNMNTCTEDLSQNADNTFCIQYTEVPPTPTPTPVPPTVTPTTIPPTPTPTPTPTPN